MSCHFNQATEMKQYLKLNKFLYLTRVYISYVKLVNHLFKFRSHILLKVSALKWILANITIIVEIGPIIDVFK